MDSLVKQFALKALHVFQVRTLSSLGLGTRVTLSNKSHNKGAMATDYRVDLTTHSPDGQTCQYIENIARLAQDAVVSLDCGQWQVDGSEDQVMIFHLIPMRLLPGVDEAGCIDIDRAEIWGLFTAQDHYVEYYRPDGFSGGVLYQSGAFNYKKFSREETTAIQAPKVFLTTKLDTMLSILHTSFEEGYEREAVLRCSLLDRRGQVVARSVCRIAPNTACMVSMKNMLDRAGVTLPIGVEMQNYTLLALCENAALLPLIFNVDSTHGTFAVEHSLPPMYYGQTVSGPVRTQMVRELKSSGLFSE